MSTFESTIDEHVLDHERLDEKPLGEKFAETTPDAHASDPVLRFALEFSKSDGSPLARVDLAIEEDFRSALDWTAFEGARQGRHPAVSGSTEGTVLPLWHVEAGAPVCSGFRVEAPANDGGEPIRCDFPVDYFEPLAEEYGRSCVPRDALDPADLSTWRLTAAPAPRVPERAAQGPDATTSAFEVEVLPESLPLRTGRLADFTARAQTDSGTRSGPNDLPVFFAQSVLDEVSVLAREGEGTETGGLLIGHLREDRDVPELFLEVTAQIPAEHAEASATQFSFTPATWDAAAFALAGRGRGRGEQIVGWHHSHPRFCSPECPPARRKDCPFARPFFSAEDIHLHRVCFPQPYQVALLLSDLPDRGFTPALFGWRAGRVAHRSYSTLR